VLLPSEINIVGLANQRVRGPQPHDHPIKKRPVVNAIGQSGAGSAVTRGAYYRIEI
jgi:hypothetical protein